MLRVAPSCSEYSQEPHPQKIRVLRAAPSCSEYSQNPHPQKIRVLRAAPSAPSAPQKSPPLKKSECSECSECSQKSYRPKIPTQSPSSSPKPSTNSALQRLTITSTKPHKSPHHFVIAPRPTTHYLCFQKSQISHVHKHNAFQFRLRNRNISSS